MFHRKISRNRVTQKEKKISWKSIIGLKRRMFEWKSGREEVSLQLSLLLTPRSKRSKQESMKRKSSQTGNAFLLNKRSPGLKFLQSCLSVRFSWLFSCDIAIGSDFRVSEIGIAWFETHLPVKERTREEKGILSFWGEKSPAKKHQSLSSQFSLSFPQSKVEKRQRNTSQETNETLWSRSEQEVKKSEEKSKEKSLESKVTKSNRLRLWKTTSISESVSSGKVFLSAKRSVVLTTQKS